MILLSDEEIQDAVVVAMYKDGELFPPFKDQYVVSTEDKAIAKAQAEKAMKESLDKAENFLDNILDCYIPGPTLSHPHDLGGLIREDWQKLRKEIEE